MSKYIIGNRFTVDTLIQFGPQFTNYKLSYRLTSQHTGSVTKFRYFVNTINGTSPTYKVGIQADDGNGNPDGTFLGYTTTTPSGTDWYVITLGTPINLTKGQVYHFVFEYYSGILDTSNYVTLRYIGDDNQINASDCLPDSNMAVRYTSDGGTTWKTIKNRTPLFLLEFSDSHYEGVPYYTLSSSGIYDVNYSRQTYYNDSNDLTINTLGVKCYSIGTPEDDLQYEIRNENNDILDSGIIVSKDDVSSSYDWYDITLTNSIIIKNSKSYYIIFKSPSTTNDQRYIIRRTVSLNNSAHRPATYGGELTTYGLSSNSGSSWSDTTQRDLLFRCESFSSNDISITIDGTDRTKYIIPESLKIDSILTRQTDRCRLLIKKIAGSITHAYKPTTGQEIIITRDSTRIFGGVITRVSQFLDSYGVLNFDVECNDYTRFLDRKLIADTFENQTVNEIISSILSTYLIGDNITDNNVDCDITLSYIGFNYLSVSKVLTELADRVGYDWYIDYYKDIHFFSKTANNSPFDIKDETGSYVLDSLKLRRDNSQVRNVVYVRGGEYLASTFTTEINSDGTRSIYDIPYRYQNLSCSLTGNSLSVGLDHLDNADEYDVLWNFQEKILRWKDVDKPSTGATIRVAGQPYLPVRIKVYDKPSINTMATAEGGSGEYEHLIIDKSIKTREGARERASAELESYKQTISEGSFVTYFDGLQTGQRIRINSTAHDIDEYYIINKITATLLTPKKFKYEISVVTTKTFGIIEYLQSQLVDETKQITIEADEVIDLVESNSETMSISATITSSIDHNRQTESMSLSATFTAQSIDYDVDFVLGPFTPSGDDRVFILNGSRLG